MDIIVRLHRNGAYWQARWTDGKGCPHGKGLGRRKDAGGTVLEHLARLECAKIQQHLDAGGGVLAKAPALGEWIERFLELRSELAEASADLYRSAGKRLVRFLKSRTIRLDQITPEDTMSFKTWLLYDEQLQRGTVGRIVRETRAMFGLAVEMDRLDKNPFQTTAVMKGLTAKPDRQWASLSVADLEKLLALAPRPWNGLLALLRLGGLRRGEALRLKWCDVDLVARRLTVVHPGPYETTKGRTRVVPIVPRLAEILLELQMGESSKSGREFQKVCPGLRAGSLWRQFRVLCQRAGIKPWERWAHTLRKNCETDWAAEFPLHVVAEWLGNSPKVALKHYLKAKDEDFRAASAVETPTPECARPARPPSPQAAQAAPPDAGLP